VAHALAAPTGRRAIIVYDGLAIDPLAVYLPGVPLTDPAGPVDVSEVDVVGYPWQATPAPLPPHVKLIGTKRVDDSLVARFSIAGGWRLTPGQIANTGSGLLGPAPQGAAVLLQGTRANG